jgi:hypothetical protein
MPCVTKVADLTGGCRHHRCRRQQADAGNRQQRGARRRLAGQRAQFAFELRDADFQQTDCLDQQRHRTADQRRHGGVGIGERAAALLDAEATALGNDNAELTAEAAQSVDARGARAHPQRACAMQRLQSLLFNRLHARWHDLGTARRFERRTGIGGIGLVALHVGADVGRWQQADLNAETVQPACPVVRRATGFHHHQAHGAIDEPALELTARKAMLFDHPPGAIGDRELEHRLREIQSHNPQSSGSIHVGLSLVALTPHTT